MDYKIDFASMHDVNNKNKRHWNKNANNNTVKKKYAFAKSKRLKPNMHSMILLVRWRNETVKHVLKKKHFVDNDKKKPITKRSTKKGATECVHLAAVLKLIAMNPSMKMSKTKINANTPRQ